jgi:hypothetical protein
MRPTDESPFVRASFTDSSTFRPDRPDPIYMCASPELRLIIITNDKEVVLGRREELDEP